jgi:hypothetical protein
MPATAAEMSAGPSRPTWALRPIASPACRSPSFLTRGRSSDGMGASIPIRTRTLCTTGRWVVGAASRCARDGYSGRGGTGPAGRGGMAPATRDGTATGNARRHGSGRGGRYGHRRGGRDGPGRARHGPGQGGRHGHRRGGRDGSRGAGAGRYGHRRSEAGRHPRGGALRLRRGAGTATAGRGRSRLQPGRRWRAPGRYANPRAWARNAPRGRARRGPAAVRSGEAWRQPAPDRAPVGQAVEVAGKGQTGPRRAGALGDCGPSRDGTSAGVKSALRRPAAALDPGSAAAPEW